MFLSHSEITNIYDCVIAVAAMALYAFIFWVIFKSLLKLIENKTNYIIIKIYERENYSYH